MATFSSGQPLAASYEPFPADGVGRSDRRLAKLTDSAVQHRLVEYQTTTGLLLASMIRADFNSFTIARDTRLIVVVDIAMISKETRP